MFYIGCGEKKGINEMFNTRKIDAYQYRTTIFALRIIILSAYNRRRRRRYKTRTLSTTSGIILKKYNIQIVLMRSENAVTVYSTESHIIIYNLFILT